MLFFWPSSRFPDSRLFFFHHHHFLLLLLFLVMSVLVYFNQFILIISIIFEEIEWVTKIISSKSDWITRNEMTISVYNYAEAVYESQYKISTHQKIFWMRCDAGKLRFFVSFSLWSVRVIKKTFIHKFYWIIKTFVIVWWLLLICLLVWFVFTSHSAR